MESKNFLFISSDFLTSCDVARRISEENHKVKVYIPNTRKGLEVYSGILDRVDNWQNFVDWADIVIFDNTGFGKVANTLRQNGKLVVGGSPYTDSLEMVREFGQKELSEAGMKILEHHPFENFDKAIEFIQKNPSRYVFKPNGSAQNDKAILFIGEEEDGGDILELLQSNKNLWKNKIRAFILQKFASGVEVAIGAFFNGENFLSPVNINFEHKRLFPGDIGPLTGDMGAMMYWDSFNSLYASTLEKMITKLRASGYVGYFDINCIANSHAVFPLECTCRFGYPTLDTQIEGIKMPLGEFFYNLVTKKNFEIPVKKGFQIGVCCYAVPFITKSHSDSNLYEDLPILFRGKKRDLEGIHLGDIKFIDGQYRIAGNSGYALVVTGSGHTVNDARKEAYERIKKIRLQNMFYRVDIGERWYYDSDLLQTWGYL